MSRFDEDVNDFSGTILSELPCGFRDAVGIIEKGTDMDYKYCCAVLFAIIDNECITNENGYLK